MERCIVLYWVTNPIRLRLEQEIAKLWDEDNAQHFNKQTDEVIVILAEPYHEVFDLTAVKQWNVQKARISFFHLKNIISNPSRHTFVPPHRKLTQAEIETVIAETHVKSKSEFPHIKYHRDMQARVLGLVPGDVVEIQRPSETCGIYTMYRVCMP
jgi:DNA-directed RNA polymerase subunit H (RpoH/RPB5)